ncbi:MAG: hypothetical protein ACLU3I_12545 [Acutalibacteraceae bacterium]
MAEPLLIPADAAQRLLAAANGDAALLYLYLLRTARFRARRRRCA